MFETRSSINPRCHSGSRLTFLCKTSALRDWLSKSKLHAYQEPVRAYLSSVQIGACHAFHSAPIRKPIGPTKIQLTTVSLKSLFFRSATCWLTFQVRRWWSSCRSYGTAMLNYLPGPLVVMRWMDVVSHIMELWHLVRSRRVQIVSDRRSVTAPISGLIVHIILYTLFLFP